MVIYHARLSQISTVLASLLFAVSERRRREFDALEVKGSRNEVSIYFYRCITDRIKSAKHDRRKADGFWRWQMTEIISAREKSENEALIYKHIFSATCNSNILNLSIIIFLYSPPSKRPPPRRMKASSSGIPLHLFFSFSGSK